MTQRDGPSCPGCGLPNYEGLCPHCRGDQDAYERELVPPFATTMTPEAEAAHRHGRMPPYTDDRGDLQEAWMRGYDAANHDAALAAEPIAASSRLDAYRADLIEKVRALPYEFGNGAYRAAVLALLEAEPLDPEGAPR